MELMFVSERGRCYTEAQVVPVVLSLLQPRFRYVRHRDWRKRVRAVMTREWLRWRNGETPGALARDIELTLIN